MKVRSGFVSNSSSASFVVPLNVLTERQLEQILDHQEEGKRLGLEYADDVFWEVEVGDGLVSGSTIMDNFDFLAFLELIGVPKDAIDYVG